MKPHPLSEIFPPLSKEALAELARDIKESGLRAPITILDKQILDGNNRFAACKQAGVEPKFKDFVGTDPIAFVISANLHRRHLTESQRAMVAAKLKETLNNKIGPIGPKSKSSPGEIRAPGRRVSAEKAAELLNVSERSVKRAGRVLTRGSKADVKAVETGKSKVAAVADKVGKNGDVIDKTGYKVPEKALKYYLRADEPSKILAAISSARSAIRKASQDDLLYVEVNLNGALDLLNQAYTEFHCAVPYAVCGVCQGVTPETCALCKGRGVISKFKWDTCVPEEMKKIRAK